uniref:DLH domain-containing protein n=1 Tax=Panagrellus redivivus TaxID=6233 RepID=A0A7E4VBX5_PANRE
MSITESRVEYADAGGKVYESYVAVPKDFVTSGKKHPTVILIPAFQGIRQHEEGMTRKLAALGYVAFALDYFGKDFRNLTVEQAFGIIKPLAADRRGEMKSRIVLGLEQAKALPYVDTNKIGVFGYCFGGTAAMDLARYNVGVAAAVSFHGNFSPLPDVDPVPEAETKPIQAKVMICHGDADDHVTIESAVDVMAEFRKRDTDFQFINYANAKHGFTDITREDAYNKLAAERSWAQSTAFLAEVLLH